MLGLGFTAKLGVIEVTQVFSGFSLVVEEKPVQSYYEVKLVEEKPIQSYEVKLGVRYIITLVINKA